MDFHIDIYRYAHPALLVFGAGMVGAGVIALVNDIRNWWKAR